MFYGSPADFLYNPFSGEPLWGQIKFVKDFTYEVIAAAFETRSALAAGRTCHHKCGYCLAAFRVPVGATGRPVVRISPASLRRRQLQLSGRPALRPVAEEPMRGVPPRAKAHSV